MPGNSPVEKNFQHLRPAKRAQAKAYLDTPPELNNRQRLILQNYFKDDNSIYLQGMAGVGKTELLIRAIFLSELLQAPGEELLILAPSAETAANLRRRRQKFSQSVARKFNFSPPTHKIYSFHAFCLQLLTETYRGEILLKQFDSSYDDNFYLLSGSEARDLWRLVCETSAGGLKSEKAEYYYRQAGKYRRQLMIPSESLQKNAAGKEQDVVTFYRKYWRLKRKRNALDYADLLFVSIDLFRRHPQLGKQFLTDYSIVFVDDFQSLTPLQFNLLTQFESADKRIFASGDPLTIRGNEESVDFNGREQFRLYFPESRVMTLTKNYRLKTLLWAALMDVLEAKGNTKKDQYPELKPANLSDKSGLAYGSAPAVFEAINADEEQKFIAHKVIKYLDEGVEPADIAVVSRLNNRQMVIKEQLARKSCRSVILQNMNFWSREVPRIVESIIRLTVALSQSGQQRGNSADFYILRLLRIFHPTEISEGLRNFAAAGRLVEEVFQAGRFPVKSATGKQFLHNLREFVENLISSGENISLLKLLELIKEKMNLARDKSLLRQARKMHQRLEALPGVKDVISFTALKELLDSIRAREVGEANVDKEEAVVVATPRLLCGREFDVVIIAMLEEGTWPLYPFGKRPDSNKLEIEKRLFYLAYSRARKEVVLTFAWRRKIMGSWKWRQPSQFLDCPAGEYVDRREVKLGGLSRLHRFCSKVSKIPV